MKSGQSETDSKKTIEAERFSKLARFSAVLSAIFIILCIAVGAMSMK